MKIVHSRAELAGARAALAGPIGLVPTMGALHAGHRSLLDRARRESTSVIATVFVNPLQFGATEDLAKYPRTLPADAAMCQSAGVDVLWAPAVEDMYPNGDPVVTVDPGPLGSELEGAIRPGHFAGVLTVVAKLFHSTRPDVSFFGEKDYQQLALIRQMVTDLDFGLDVVGVPTVRDTDGLALSSRNVYLSPDERQRALAIPRALDAGAAAALQGGIEAVLPAARSVLDEAGLVPDYLALRAGDLTGPPVVGSARLLVAVKVGTTRLIDNVGL